MSNYKIDPKLVKMKDELLEHLQEHMSEGHFDRNDLPRILGIVLGISYCHEFFRMAEVFSRQLLKIFIQLEK
jgi:hypothetical protein